MRGYLRSFLIGFVVVVVFGGWYLLPFRRLENEAVLIVPVLLGLIAAVVARRPTALVGAIVGLYVWYGLAHAVGMTLGDGWQVYAIVLPVLIATGFAGGRALLWLRTASGAASRP